MPLNIDILQILLHMLNFAILAGGLTFLLFKPVNKFLDERAAHFAAEEEKNRADAEENARLRAEYEQKLAAASEEIAELRANAEQNVAEMAKSYVNNAKTQASAIVAAAEREAEERKAHILEAAQTEIGELVITAAQKLVSDTDTPERDAALYDAFIRLTEETVPDERKNT